MALLSLNRATLFIPGVSSKTLAFGRTGAFLCAPDFVFADDLMGLLLGLRVPIERAIPYLLFAMILLSLLTILNRARHALLELKNTAAPK